MKRALFFAAVLAVQTLVCSSVCTAKDYAFGIYITDLHNLDQVNAVFSADFWIWAVYPGEETNFDGTLDFLNAQEFETFIYTNEVIDGSDLYWMQQKISGTFRCAWDLKNYPFDKNRISIEIEDVRDIETISFVPDTVNSKISSMASLEEWNISPLQLKSSPVCYNTNFGNTLEPETASMYSRITAEFTVSRKTPLITFFKLTVGAYIAFVLSLIALRMKPDTDSRLALPCAALFAVVSNKYVVESAVPSSASLTLLDSIHSLTMFSILGICCILIITDGMRVSGDRDKLRWSYCIDTVAAIVIAAAYICANLVFCFC